jgi:hypothetical protein
MVSAQELQAPQRRYGQMKVALQQDLEKSAIPQQLV